MTIRFSIWESGKKRWAFSGGKFVGRQKYLLSKIGIESELFRWNVGDILHIDQADKAKWGTAVRTEERRYLSSASTTAYSKQIHYSLRGI
jgi:hypothetical protein